MSSHIRFISGTPRKEIDPTVALSEWWGEVEAAKQAESKVVFVTQVTIMIDYSMLLVPTIGALADRDDCIVIAVLGQKDAKLEGVTVPANTKAEVSMRGEWSGIGVNLRTATSTVEAIRDGVDKILTNSKYKACCVATQRKNEELDCRAQLERFISELYSG
ncbi:uncharacterized protein BDV17DRAFT_287627 [Aspergillus undulatus]|uniref:uncharacterized protein n=1 Tax=Aspergillus undulatus TaxID=1810928 RepID=UPI003CCE0E77